MYDSNFSTAVKHCDKLIFFRCSNSLWNLVVAFSSCPCAIPQCSMADEFKVLLLADQSGTIVDILVEDGKPVAVDTVTSLCDQAMNVETLSIEVAISVLGTSVRV
eukprot:Gb_32006 [translate_table: standard]